MKKELIVLGLFIILTAILLSCTMSGDVVITNKDSFRMISPDFDFTVRRHECNADDEDCNQPEKKN